MSAPTARLAFIKLNTGDLEAATAFWQEAFGFAVTGSYDVEAFRENIMALPGQSESGPQLMLVEPKPRGPQPVGPGHGPVGLVVVDIAASQAHAMASGAEEVMPPTDVGGVIVSLLKAPDGHEIELVQPLAG
ncbi:VOC family protein [Aurantiacibacter sp. MUD11]|uniref:VOC family protein n=1 Tax=Aurantiacibacter sp. MUD11 TaxID=3003265 RepID=UPI0022AB1F3B|nr:VOC family protein [Aurantiacibacter sp. MUD11]WAT17898.1 VOC family protein [Aurantiacibacter sp. MUD11]